MKSKRPVIGFVIAIILSNTGFALAVAGARFGLPFSIVPIGGTGPYLSVVQIQFGVAKGAFLPKRKSSPVGNEKQRIVSQVERFVSHIILINHQVKILKLKHGQEPSLHQLSVYHYIRRLLVQAKFLCILK